MFARFGPLALGLMSLTGCVVEVHNGPTHHDFREFDRKDWSVSGSIYTWARAN